MSEANAKHRAHIAASAMGNDEDFIRCGLFVLLTIQQGFYTVAEQLADVDLHGYESKYLWGWKSDGYRFLRENARRLRTLCLVAKHRGDTVDAIDTLMEVPGLGVIKGAFFAQLLGFDAGCIDRHNAILYGVNVDSFRVPAGQKAKTRLAKISAYVDLCYKLGGGDYLWDTWCTYVAALYPDTYTDGEHVSRDHLLAVKS